LENVLCYSAHLSSTKFNGEPSQRDSPVIVSIIPAVSPLRGGVQMQLTGANFANGVVVKIDGIIVDAKPTEPSTLTLTCPPFKTEGFKTVEVLNPSGTSCRLDNVLYYLNEELENRQTKSQTKFVPPIQNQLEVRETVQESNTSQNPLFNNFQAVPQDTATQATKRLTRVWGKRA